jgi:hypothetical protein
VLRLGADRDDARLEELRLFDVEQRSRKIDVLDFETTGLPATKSGTIQEQYERPQRVCVDPGTLVAAGIAAKMRFSSASE